MKEMNGLFGKGIRRILTTFLLQAFFYTITNSLVYVIQITAFTYGWSMIQKGELETRDLYKVYGTMTFSSMILGAVYSQIPDQKKARSAAKTALKMIERVSKIDSMSNEGVRPDLCEGNIEFKNVSFEYPTRPGVRILNDFNLVVRNGETNALVGQSGCGKSTTISLLLRFYDVTDGTIELDGVDIRNLNIEWLRSKIGIVSQEPILFDYSIRKNIENGDLTRSDVKKICSHQLHLYIFFVFFYY